MSERNKNAIFKQKILHFHIYFISLQQLLMLMTRSDVADDAAVGIRGFDFLC